MCDWLYAINITIGWLMLNDNGQHCSHPFAWLCKMDTNHSCNHPEHQSFLPCWIPKRIKKRGSRDGWVEEHFLNAGIRRIYTRTFNKPSPWLLLRRWEVKETQWPSNDASSLSSTSNTDQTFKKWARERYSRCEEMWKGSCEKADFSRQKDTSPYYTHTLTFLISQWLRCANCYSKTWHII